QHKIGPHFLALYLPAAVPAHGCRPLPCCLLQRMRRAAPVKPRRGAQKARGLPYGTPRACRCGENQVLGELFLRMTSWLAPSTMEVEDTTVRRAFCCSSGMESAPQLHMVDRTLYSVVCTPSASGPA